MSTMLESPMLVREEDSLRATLLSSSLFMRGNTVALIGATRGGKRNTLRASSPYKFGSVKRSVRISIGDKRAYLLVTKRMC